MPEEIKTIPPQEIKANIDQKTVVNTPLAVKKVISFNRPVIIYIIIGVIEILLLFRFVFKLSAADPASGFVSFIYNATNFLVAPYSGFVFEPGTLIAMVVYAILAWGIAKIIIIATGRRNLTPPS